MQETSSLIWGEVTGHTGKAEPGRQKQPGSSQKSKNPKVPIRVTHTHTHKSNKDQKHKHICTSITKRVGLTMGKGRGLNRHKGGDGKQTQVKIINYLNYYYHEP